MHILIQTKDLSSIHHTKLCSSTADIRTKWLNVRLKSAQNLYKVSFKKAAVNLAQKV